MTAPSGPLTVTPRQLEILRFVSVFRRDRGVSPTLAETATSFGVAVQTIHGHIRALVDRGALEGGDGLCRGLAVTESAAAHLAELGPGRPRRSA